MINYSVEFKGKRSTVRYTRCGDVADVNFSDKLGDPNYVPEVTLLTSFYPPNTVADKRFMSAIETFQKGAIRLTIFEGWFALHCFVVQTFSIHIYTPKLFPVSFRVRGN